MYAFVDRPVESLCNGGRFLLWAMRAWVSAAERGRCPPRMLHRGFAAVNAAGALPDFHIAMALLGGGAVETPIQIGRASGRARVGPYVYIRVVAGAYKKKKNK